MRLRPNFVWVVKVDKNVSVTVFILRNRVRVRSPGGEVLPYMGYIGMCRCEGYGFQAVYSRIGYINQNIWV